MGEFDPGNGRKAGLAVGIDDRRWMPLPKGVEVKGPVSIPFTNQRLSLSRSEALPEIGVLSLGIVGQGREKLALGEAI